MAGHSKWANIKHRKERSDAKKGKIFTKIGREIYVAVKSGGADPESNNRLKDVIAKAKASNMPNDNIMRSIKKASGEGSSESFENITYEGYGPGGVAVIVETMTDNRNRTAADIRHLFDKYGGNLGTTGCVSYMFDRKGVLIIEKKDSIEEDSLMLTAIDSGADDFNIEEEYYEVTCSPPAFSHLRETLEKEGYDFVEADIQMVPQTMTKLDEKDIPMMEKLNDLLEDLDDVQNIYHNWDN